MYPYVSPTGAGMTPNKELADRMEKLRADYIEACKGRNVEAQERIKNDERQVVLLIGNEEARRHLDEYDEKQKAMPRCVRVTSYEGARAVPHHLYIDTHEVEMIRVEIQGPHIWRVFMKSGREFETNEDDFNLIERAMKERQ